MLVNKVNILSNQRFFKNDYSTSNNNNKNNNNVSIQIILF